MAGVRDVFKVCSLQPQDCVCMVGLGHEGNRTVNVLVVMLHD